MVRSDVPLCTVYTHIRRDAQVRKQTKYAIQTINHVSFNFNKRITEKCYAVACLPNKGPENGSQILDHELLVLQSRTQQQNCRDL